MRRMIIIGLILIVGLACTRDYESVFLIGEVNNNLTRTILDPSIEMLVGGFDEYEYSIDLNQDGVDDLLFKGSSAVAASGNEWNDWSVEAQNSACEFATQEVTHTFKVCTRFVEDKKFLTYYSDKYLYNCSDIESNDDTIEKFWSPIVYNQGDQVDTSVEWKGSATYLTQFSYTNNYTAHDEDDPIWTAWYKVYGNWPDVTDKFLLVRLKDGMGYSYGWVKLTFSGTNHIKITEFAISG